MAGYILKSPTFKMWSNWWWLLGVSSQTIIIFTCKMLLFNGKSFFRCQKGPQTHLLMGFNSIRIMAGYTLKSPKTICGVTGDACLVFPAKLLLYSL